MRLKIALKDKDGNEEYEFFANRRDLARAEKWAKAFQMLFVDALLADADLTITIEREKGENVLII